MLLASPAGSICRLIRTLFLLCCCTVVAAPTHALATDEPEVAVREVFQQLLQRLAKHPKGYTLSRDEVYEIFDTLLKPHIDFKTLARWILQEHWVNATEIQHDAFLKAFQDYIINTYALALSVGKEINLDVQNNPKVIKNSAVVDANLSIEDSEPVPLTFRLLQRGEMWLLFDVSFSGVSLAKTFRSDFSYIAQNGGIDAVTASLVERQNANQQINSSELSGN